jgi:hypothetical protein
VTAGHRGREPARRGMHRRRVRTPPAIRARETSPHLYDHVLRRPEPHGTRPGGARVKSKHVAILTNERNCSRPREADDVQRSTAGHRGMRPANRIMIPSQSWAGAQAGEPAIRTLWLMARTLLAVLLMALFYAAAAGVIVLLTWCGLRMLMLWTSYQSPPAPGQGRSSGAPRVRGHQEMTRSGSLRRKSGAPRAVLHAHGLEPA